MTETEIFAYEKVKDGVKLWRCYSCDPQADVPELLEGQPVVEVAAYGFSGHMEEGRLEALKGSGRLRFGTREGRRVSPEDMGPGKGELPALRGMEVESVSLPPSLKRIGKYAFYNCGNLKRLSFSSSVNDLGAGLFTGCHQIRELSVNVVPEGPSCLREVLLELSEELRVDYRADGGYGRLLFPEFYEEGVENTPARILMTQVHGSGLPFRNCFLDTRFQFSWYDRRFDLARFQEREDLVLEMALGRLLYPLELEPEARERYEAYVAKRLLPAGQWLLGHKGCQELSWLLEREAFCQAVTEPLLSGLLEYAREERQAEAVSYLMDLRHRRFPPKARVFEL